MSPFRILAAVVAPLIMACSAKGEPLAEGAALPATPVPSEEGKPVDLAKASSKGWTLVYFYPKADTPGCTKQACSLRDSFAQLTEKGVTVYGASMDDVAAQKAFKEKYKLPFTLLADKEAKLADAFGVPHAAGFTKRQAFLFKEGKLVWKDLEASTDQQAADVLGVLAKH